ncbi:MAG: exosortase, partial [Deltaproteobacteria bacterium]|nr:exosortase [Deltaproteobacteria bacterium]
MKRNLELPPYIYIPIYGVLVGWVYFDILSWLVGRDWHRGDFNYCYLIPFVVLYLIWEKRGELKGISSARSWGGMGVLLIGMALFWIGELSGEFYTQYISFWLVVISLVWTHLGFRKLLKIGFPLVMILTMFPSPHFITNQLTLGLKLLSSKLGVWMMQAYGMSAYREGNIIDLGFTQLQVVDACSGLRFLFPMIVMGLILAYFYK